MVRILLSVLQFRINARYVEANPPFTGIGEWRTGGVGAVGAWKGHTGCPLPPVQQHPQSQQQQLAGLGVPHGLSALAD